MIERMVIGEHVGDEWTINFGEYNHETDIAIPKSFALELLNIKKEFTRLKAELHEATLRASEYKNEWESALYREQGLKAENLVLGNLKDGFIQSLKAENARLAKESERRKFLLKECEKESKFRGEEIAHLKESRSKWAKQSSENADEVDRLTSALAMAHEALKGFMDKGIKDNDALEFAEYVLADKDGSLALERWKKMEAVVETARKHIKEPHGNHGDSYGMADLIEALEALDAKGDGDV